MKEFIYPLAHIFSTKFLLKDLNVSHYYIASYQRGYKWKSFSKSDQVPMLLADIYEAFKMQASEYYLQYITVKKNYLNPSLLEVIDGQQRLTTLSLMFYVSEAFGGINYAKDIVVHQRYKSNVKFKDVFASVLELGLENDVIQNHQDIYYLFHAKECIFRFFKSLGDELNAYLDYLLCKVKIIVNIEDELTSPEEVFSNLNDNKVDLTNYYLVKGLLFTQSTRRENTYTSFLEIQENRSRLARNWDQLNQWFLNEKQSQLFFYKYNIINKRDENIGINSILNLAKPKNLERQYLDVLQVFFSEMKHKGDSTVFQYDDMALFNLYLEEINDSHQAEQKLEEVQNLAKRFINWYADDELYHLIGYYIVTGQSIETIKDLGKTELKKVLYKWLYKSLQLKEDQRINNLEYGTDNSILNRIFLAINAFPMIFDNGKYKIEFLNRFNFYTYTTNKWSIEHIYPQTPKVEPKDVVHYRNWFLNKTSNHVLKAKINAVSLEDDNIEEEISNLGLLNINENFIGNLALLEQGNNSTLSNNVFPRKRELLLSMLAQGDFVPQHTINAVCKNLALLKNPDVEIRFSTHLIDWAEEDMHANALWLEYTYKLLIDFIKENI